MVEVRSCVTANRKNRCRRARCTLRIVFRTTVHSGSMMPRKIPSKRFRSMRCQAKGGSCCCSRSRKASLRTLNQGEVGSNTFGLKVRSLKTDCLGSYSRDIPRTGNRSAIPSAYRHASDITLGMWRFVMLDGRRVSMPGTAALLYRHVFMHCELSRLSLYLVLADDSVLSCSSHLWGGGNPRRRLPARIATAFKRHTRR